MKTTALFSVLALVFALTGTCKEARSTMDFNALIKTKGIPTLVISGFENTDKGDGFKLLTIYGVNSDPRVVAAQSDGALKNHWLLFTDDAHFIRQVGVHFDGMKNPSVYLGLTLFASRSSSGSKFQLVQISDEGHVAQILDVVANMVKLEVGDKGHEIRLQPKK